MTIFGLKFGDLLKVLLEWITANRRHRKELGREYERGGMDTVAAAQAKERDRVQEASAADDALPADADSVRNDPNNQWSP